jgi:uncharacterized protein YecT (DUF1311 family)
MSRSTLAVPGVLCSASPLETTCHGPRLRTSHLRHRHAFLSTRRNTLIRSLPFVLTLALCAARTTNAACTPSGPPEELQECAVQQLILQDNATRKFYERLMKVLPTRDQLKLESEQASWEGSRESRCEKLLLHSIKSLPMEIQQTNCLIFLSEQRENQLRKRLLHKAPFYDSNVKAHECDNCVRFRSSSTQPRDRHLDVTLQGADHAGWGRASTRNLLAPPQSTGFRRQKMFPDGRYIK